MSYRLFQYALTAPSLLADLNAYLGSRRVGSVAHHLVPVAGGMLLVFIGQTVAHARFGGDVAWWRAMQRFSRLGEAPAPATRDARRLVGQHGPELPFGLSQREASRQPQQESGLPGLSGPRHGGSPPPDDAPSRARRPLAGGRDETKGAPSRAEIRTESGGEKGWDGAEFSPEARR